MDCCDEVSTIEFLSEWWSNDFGLLLTLFITGLAGSFTHCIGMCGPIAINQMSIRLMHMPKNNLSEKNKLLCAASIPYYLGKSVTYSLLAIASVMFSNALDKIAFFRYLGASLILLAALFFVCTAFSKNFSLLKLTPKPFVKIIEKLQKLLANYTHIFSINPFGYKGWMMGMTLGLLPCGLVYASIATLVSNTGNIIISALGMFLFGIGTIPGLFLVSYLGEQVMMRWNKIFQIFYSLSMALNAYLLSKAALKMLSF